MSELGAYHVTRRSGAAAVTAAMALFALTACTGDDEVPTRSVQRTAPSLEVSPKATTLEVGGSKQLTAVVRDGAGNVISVPVTWSSSDPQVVSVTATGLVTAVAPGNGSVIASAENGARNSASFGVLGSPSSIQIDGPTGLLSVGSTRQLVAQAYGASGVPMSASVSWSSSQPSIASVNGAGVVVAIGEGEAIITASSGTASGTFSVRSAFLTASLVMSPSLTSVEPGSEIQLSVTPRDASGNILSLPVVWQLVKQNSPISLSATGLLTVPAGTKGSAVVTATVTDAGGETSVTSIVNPLRHGNPLTGLSGSNSGNNADNAVYYVLVPNGTTSLSVSLGGGTNDPDLYVTPAAGSSAAECAPWLGNGATETCTFSNPTPGIWKVRIEGYSATWAGWTLTTTLAPAP